MIQSSDGKEIRVAELGNVVPEGYRYYEKVVVPGEDLSLPNAYLKWYNLCPDEEPITQEEVITSRGFLQREAETGRLKLEGELGFVILHRASSVLLLLLTVWRR